MLINITVTVSNGSRQAQTFTHSLDGQFGEAWECTLQWRAESRVQSINLKCQESGWRGPAVADSRLSSPFLTHSIGLSLPSLVTLVTVNYARLLRFPLANWKLWQAACYFTGLWEKYRPCTLLLIFIFAACSSMHSHSQSHYEACMYDTTWGHVIYQVEPVRYSDFGAFLRWTVTQTKPNQHVPSLAFCLFGPYLVLVPVVSQSSCLVLDSFICI